MYVADSESSSIRCVTISNGSVKGVVGGGLDPMVTTCPAHYMSRPLCSIPPTGPVCIWGQGWEGEGG